MMDVPPPYDINFRSVDYVRGWAEQAPEFNCDRAVLEILQSNMTRGEQAAAIWVYFTTLDRIYQLM